ncbi:hybrid sensor histidine kinase/response regulator [Pseudomonas sp. TKO26]|uniref:response regulator n=1 Tax=unclassified Pseudomonas TaxID=196821 RepID=UPI000D80F18E|nr:MULTISPECIES: response regulator [unclassified Pseudomonas]PYY81642.1 hybrid sensor histidine kinase/response regulator [Pseudomonas sp. TKO30]PYY82933.1 hybrid sensor histidine kinase/response regulator [Pseudomonas sp. TKO29]PYY84743.1 hybrid sensor histidine kinase/response regulator [Pseudomonas sp. TKO26]PYY97747.1 hybrid sensor histidine kinase/response regulator [Pseudomonas sp. TKO14]
MIKTLLQPVGIMTLIFLLLAALLNQARLYRQLRQQRRQLPALARSAAALEAGKQRAEAADRNKSRFLGHLGHELRTPLNALIGLLELVLRRTGDSSPNHAPLELALGAASDLKELLDDLLDISRIESGHLRLNPTWVDLRDCVEGLVGVYDAQARQKHLALELEFNAPSPAPQVLIDVLRFKQVLGNLLSNAIKFTQQGTIQVRATLQPAASHDRYQLLLQVQDSGIGIPEQQRQGLLLPFAQIDPDSQSPRNSAGLGLPISHQLCRQMGGSLSLHGRSGPGCEARVRLPLRGRTAQPAADAAEPLPTAAVPLDVLLADDHRASLTLLQGQLEYLGHRVTCADDGRQAFELWRQGDFDLLILDCNMPSMDGYQLAEAIRQYETREQRPAITLIGCSASTDPQALQRGLDAGMHDCLAKPLSLERLSHRLASLKPRPRTDSFSLSTLRTLTRGKPLFARRMLNELLRCCQEDRRQLERIPASDPRALVALAHKIKGSALMVGAESLQAGCEALEQACLPPVAQEAITAAVRRLDRDLVHFAQSLHRHLDEPPSQPPKAQAAEQKTSAPQLTNPP